MTLFYHFYFQIMWVSWKHFHIFQWLKEAKFGAIPAELQTSKHLAFFFCKERDEFKD